MTRLVTTLGRVNKLKFVQSPLKKSNWYKIKIPIGGFYLGIGIVNSRKSTVVSLFNHYAKRCFFIGFSFLRSKTDY